MLTRIEDQNDFSVQIRNIQYPICSGNLIFPRFRISPELRFKSVARMTSSWNISDQYTYDLSVLRRIISMLLLPLTYGSV